jgi:hypothetical protein
VTRFIKSNPKPFKKLRKSFKSAKNGKQDKSNQGVKIKIQATKHKHGELRIRTLT